MAEFNLLVTVTNRYYVIAIILEQAYSTEDGSKIGCCDTL